MLLRYQTDLALVVAFRDLTRFFRLPPLLLNTRLSVSVIFLRNNHNEVFVTETCNGTEYFAFIDYVFDHQSEFYNGVFFNKTERDLYDLFASYAVQFGVPKATFWTEMNGDYAADVARRYFFYFILNNIK